MDIGLHQSTKWVQLRDHAEAEEEENCGEDEENEEQTASTKGSRVGL